jgi:hypothetical protein
MWFDRFSHPPPAMHIEVWLSQWPSQQGGRLLTGTTGCHHITGTTERHRNKAPLCRCRINMYIRV